MLRISVEEFCFIADRALDGMADQLRRLGDDFANRRPDLPGGNSPYAIVFHCLGMLEFWVDGVVLGRPVVRDREAEFEATGPVEPLLGRVAAARQRLRSELIDVDARAPVRGTPHDHYVGTPIGTTAGGALLHVLEELCQHHGQLEVTSDVLLTTDRTRRP